MKIPTEAEIDMMDDDIAENTYNQLEKEYEKKFGITYIAPPNGFPETIQEHLGHLAKYLMEEKASPWTLEDYKDID